MNTSSQYQYIRKFSVLITTLPKGVRADSSEIIGTGVIVSENGEIATCAHVLKDAVASNQRKDPSKLSLQDIKEKGYRVQIGLFLEGGGIEWRQAVLESYLKDFEDDIVVLQLDGNLPLPASYTAFLGKVDTNHSNQFCSFGFRFYKGKARSGGYAKGCIYGLLPIPPGENLQYEPVQLCTKDVAPGMSGAPVLDLTQNLVVALISDNYRLDSQRPSDAELALAVNADILASEPFNIPVRGESLSLHDNPLPLWNVPSPNPFFTGRDQELRNLYNQLQQSQISAVRQPQVLSGLGGIGKTQIALAYAYRFSQYYQAIFWVGADTPESLMTGYINIAELLSLPQKDEENQAVILKAVKAWLQTNNSWLLILDNVNDLTLVRQFLPSATKGHILLTTRIADLTSLNLGIVHSVEVQTLSPEQGTLLLLRRAKLLASDALLNQADPQDRDVARQLSQELGGLPLALDQAGAYIASTHRSLTKYLEMYHQNHAKVLKERRNDAYPESVATTWNISFQHIEAKNHAATDLLQLCAYLAPDAIPEEILTQGAERLGPVLGPVVADPFQLDNAIEVTRAYSLLNRDPRTQMLSVHRLVQVVLRDAMLAEAVKKQWKQRAVLAVEAASPDIAQWDACGRWLPHALVCAQWIQEPEWIPSKENADLLYHAGNYLCKRAQYSEAEPLHVHALSLRENILGSEHPDVATSLNALAMLYHELGHYDGEVLEMAQRALSIREKVFGKDSLEVADSLDSLSLLHKALGHYEKAWPLCQQAHSIRVKLGKESLEVATSMNNLAMLHKTLGRYEEARLLLEQAYRIKKEKIKEGKLDPNDPSLATSMNNLAMLYHELGRYDSEVLKLCEDALSIRKAKLASEHLLVRSLGNLTELYRARGSYEKALQCSHQASSICEQKLDDTYPDKAHSLNTQAMLYYDQGRYEEALPLCEQALRICEKTIKSEHPDVAVSTNNLAMLYKAVGNTEKALSLSQDALTLKKKLLAPWYPHPSLARSMNNLAMLYYNQGRYEEALPLCEQAHILFDLVFGPEHPDVATSLNNLAMLYHSQGHYEEALLLYQRALSIREKLFGLEHPDVATSMNNLAMLYQDQGHYEEALPLYQRALHVCKQSLGKTHPITQVIQQNSAYHQQNM
jgi:tetratricopeptide (TPR) repeat protein